MNYFIIKFKHLTGHNMLPKSTLFKIDPTTDEIGELSDLHQGLVIGALAGETYKDLSYNFGIPVGTVKSRLSRARCNILKSRKDAESSKH